MSAAATTPPPGLDDYERTVRTWLEERLPRREPGLERSLSIFHDLPADEERELLARITAWTRTRYDAGYGAISWPADAGGAGLTAAHEEVFAQAEKEFVTPGTHELPSISTALIAPTVQMFGTPEQKARLVRPMLRGDELACQLFSEPGAGSDLAGLATRAVRDGDGWVVTGQKVWSSGAQFAQWGELIARTDPTTPKHKGLTAFLLPMESPGVDVRPLRQMSGGSSFCEVFLDDVRIPDELRLGAVGAGWSVTLATLGFERGHSGAGFEAGGGFTELLATSTALDSTGDPEVRRLLAQVWVAERLAAVAAQRDREARAAGAEPGPIGSLRKLAWTQRLELVSAAAAVILGRDLVADPGEVRGTRPYEWTAHVLGAPGYRIAGGSDEIQRSIIAERLLGLPPEPRADRGLAWQDIPR
ncbi:MAG: acyl-CoA dehydrogenase [Pseudonocardia sp. SCN 72-86]|nr:MAG: acyl-CoA dehydrogenase [Pseudonocardia sp. SCN 72-86]